MGYPLEYPTIFTSTVYVYGSFFKRHHWLRFTLFSAKYLYGSPNAWLMLQEMATLNVHHVNVQWYVSHADKGVINNIVTSWNVDKEIKYRKWKWFWHTVLLLFWSCDLFCLFLSVISMVISIFECVIFWLGDEETPSKHVWLDQSLYRRKIWLWSWKMRCSLVKLMY